VVGSKDIYRDFVDGNIIVTNNDGDRICKNEMHELFHSKYPAKHITSAQVISSMKEKKIQYSSSKHFRNVQGCLLVSKSEMKKMTLMMKMRTSVWVVKILKE
jgi:hypothetical protein